MIEWDVAADVVVVGSGAAGAAAALTATGAGARVVVVEKAAFAGGTTGKSGGVMWVPNNPLMQAAGQHDPRPQALAYMARSAFPADYRATHPTLGLSPNQFGLIEAVYDRGAEAVRSLADAAGFDLEPVPYPNYYSELAEDAAPLGRVIQVPFPPGHRRGIDPSGGQLLVDRLLDAAIALGARVLLNHAVEHLIRDDEGPAIGVEVRTGRRTVLVGAEHGVIFASGGFLHNRQLTQAHLRGPVLGGGAVEQASGDFVRIGIEAGAQLGNMNHAWWDQVAVEHAVTVTSTSRDVYSPFGDSMILVNRYGKRVVNEKAPYNERGQAHLVWDPSRLEYPNLLLFMIFDDDVMQSTDPNRFRWPVPMPGTEIPTLLISAPTLVELANEIRQRLTRLAPAGGEICLDAEFDATLAETIERFNGFARDGHDPDFLRGRAAIERVWASPARDGGTLTMHPLRTDGPFHCVILGPGALDTKGGPVIDARARVLDLSGTPIPGLYGADNCIASPAGQAYWGPGGTIGPAITFGHIAALEATARLCSPDSQLHE